MKHIFGKSIVLLIVFLSYLPPVNVCAQDFIPVLSINYELSHWSQDEHGNDMIAISVGDIGHISIYVGPDDATIKEVSCNSSAPDVVTVSSGGEIVRALSAGDAVITIRSMDPSYTEVVAIAVKVFDIKQGEMTISPHILNLETGDINMLAAVVENPDRPDYPFYVSNVTWSISDDIIAKMDHDGTITAITPGEAFITATTDNGITATCTVAVTRKPPPKPLQPRVILISGSVESGNLIDGALSAGSQVKVLCDTEDARIKYTLDDSDPEFSSDTWTASGTNIITINQKTTIRAVAINDGVVSNEFRGNYLIKLRQPISNSSDIVYHQGVSLDYSSYLYGTKVELYPSDFTGGEIRYTIDGSEPDQSSRLYTAPITLNESLPRIYYTSVDFTRNIKAKVFKDDYHSSDVRMFVFRVVPAKPVFDPESRTITCSTPGAQIYYRTDGNAPNTNDILYTGPLIPPASGNLKINARAFKDGFSPSPSLEFNFGQQLPIPIVVPYAGAPATAWVESPASFVVTPGHGIRLLCPTNYLGATVRYTTNGTEPTASSTAYIYGTPIVINSATTVKAKAFHNGSLNPSETATFKYTMATPPGTPSASPPSSTVVCGTEVRFSAASATGFLYTTNGTTPEYTGQNSYNGTSISATSTVRINEDCTIKIRAYKHVSESNAGGTYNSVLGPVATFTYKANPKPQNFDMGTFNFTIGDYKMVGGKLMNFNMNNNAGSQYVSNGAVKVTIGNNFPLGANAANRDEAFKNLKTAIDAHNRGDVKKYINPIGKSATIASVSAGFEIAGYMEGVMGPNGPTGLHGQMMMCADVSAYWEQWIAFLNVGVGFKGGVNYWGGTTDSGKPSSVMGYYVGISTSAGIGIPLIASVGVKGSATFYHDWDMINNYNKIWLNGNVSVWGKVLWFKKSQTVVNGTWNIRNIPSSSSSASLSSLTEKKMFDFSNNYELMPRKAASPWLGTSLLRSRSSVSMFNVLQHSIYSEAAPQIATLSSGKRVMVFLADDATRDDYNRTVLMYSIYDPLPDTWSSPQAVNDDGTADFYPSIASDGTNLWVAWQRSKTMFNATSTVEDMFAAGEIVAAKFNISTNVFHMPTVLTSNNIMDAMPKITVTNENTMVTWIQNSGNDINGTNGMNKIMAAGHNGSTWDGIYDGKSGLGPIIDCDIAFFGGKYQIACVIDKDNDLETIDDRDLILVPHTGDMILQTPVTNKSVSGVHFTTINGAKVLVWFEEGKLRSMTEDNVIKDLTAEPDMPTDKYKVLSNGTKTSVVYPYCVDEIGYLFARDYEAGQLGKPYKLVKTEGYAGQFDGILESTGEFNMVFNNSKMEFVDDDFEEENDLLSVKVDPPVNIRLTDISYSKEDVKIGKPLNMSLDVENIGGVAVSNVTVKVDGTAAGAYSVSLKSGEKTTLDFALNVPSDMTPLTKFVITVEPVGLTDVDQDDNSFTVTLGYTNFSMQLSTVYSDIYRDDYVYGEDEYPEMTVTVITDITNNSDFATNAMLLVRRGAADGDAIDRVELGNIAGRQNIVTELEYNIASLFDEGEQYMPLYFELITDREAEFSTSGFIVLQNNENALGNVISGYAFEMVNGEAVPLAGVTATCWVADDENGTGAKIWTEIMNDDEQANPQITQEDGGYEWNIPEGWWQVRLTKNGYEDTQSEWLPVPPSQFAAVEMKKTGKIETGIDEFGISASYSDNSIFVYPNPTTGQLRIESREVKIENIEVFDATGKRQNTEGKKQKSSLSLGNEWSEFVLDISHLPSGIYFLRIKTGDREITHKVVKE